MRLLEDIVYDALDENEITEDQHIPLGSEGQFTATVYDRLVVIRRGDDIVAISQSGMLHESITLFETGLEELLAIDKITDADGYELDDLREGFYEPPFPAKAAVWVKRLPGPFYSSSTTRFSPERVHPLPADAEFELGGDDFGHILIGIEMAARNEREKTYREPYWGFPA